MGTHAMEDTSSKLSFVKVHFWGTVLELLLPSQASTSIVGTLMPFSVVVACLIVENKRSKTGPSAILKISLIDISIRVLECTVSMTFIILVCSIKDPAIFPNISFCWVKCEEFSVKKG